MSESVEQAALRRARETRDDLPAPFGSIFGAVDAISTLNDARFRHVLALQDEIARCHSQLAEQGDAILALTNRIESVTRWHHDLRDQLNSDVKRLERESL